MWIILNPAKSHRFTTKGINLHKGSPTAFVDPSLENEHRATIERAIADGIILRIDNEMTGMAIPKQAKIDNISDNDTAIQVNLKHERDQNGKILSTTIVMPDEDGNAIDKPTEENRVIMTGIQEIPIEDLDEDEIG